MKKELIVVAVAAWIFGLATGLVAPKFFSSSQLEPLVEPSTPFLEEEALQEKLIHAITEYQKILRDDANNVAAWANLGNLYYDTNQYQQAIEAYQQALALEPGLDGVRVDMATMYRKLGQYDKAIEELQSVLANDQKNPAARLNLGIILKQDKKDYQQALQVWEEFLKLFPGHPESPVVAEWVTGLKQQLGETK